jgi:PKD domain-containing protein/cytochrome c
MSRSAGKATIFQYFFILSAGWLCLAGCAGRGGKPPPAGSTPQVPAGTVDFATDIQPIFNRSCSCHTTLNPQGGLVLKEGLSYGALVGVASAQRPQLLRVKPGDPEASYLFIKIDPSPASRAQLSGDLMPLELPPLTADDVATIRRWIEEGAAREAPRADKTPPDFAGLASAVADGPFSVVLAWPEAVDDQSKPEEITYLVYVAAAPGAEDFSLPSQSFKGVLTARIEGLEPEKTYYFVVRAMDSSRNTEQNAVERSATTPAAPPPTEVDFDTRVLPILRARCLGCHGGDSAEGCPGSVGLCVDSYDSLERTGFNGRVVIPGDSANSELVKRVRVDSVPRMPLDGPPFLTGEEIQLIASWIDQGALRSTAGGNRPPTATAGGPYSGYQGQPIAFASPDGFDPDGDPVTYSWDFGDGAQGEGRFPWHAYAAGGDYTVKLKASDGKSESPVSTAAVKVIAVTGDLPQNVTVQRICGGCHGLRVTLEDGRRGLAAPAPAQATRYFPAGVVLDARARTAKSWNDTVLRMLVHGATPTTVERSQIQAYLVQQYATLDRRAEIFVGRCSGCHTAALAMVIPRSVTMWRETVERMVNRYGAVMTELERFSIAGYLGEVMEGPPPAALDPLMGQLFVNRTCSSCHSWLNHAFSSQTHQYLTSLQTYEGARSIAGQMIANGCGQKGVMEAIAARELVEFIPQGPELLSIDTYDFSATTLHLSAVAFSSSFGKETLTLLTEDGRSFPMVYSAASSIYTAEVDNVTPPPGRIAVISTGKGYVVWGKPIPQ